MANPSPLDLTQLDQSQPAGEAGFDALQFVVTQPQNNTTPVNDGVTRNPDGSYTVASNAPFGSLGYAGGNDPTITDYTVSLGVTPVQDPLYQYAVNFYQDFNASPFLSEDYAVDGYNADSILLQNLNSDPNYVGNAYLIISDSNILNNAGLSGNLPSNLTFSDTGPLPLGITVVPCFAQGTRLRTPSGWAPVEALAVGDSVQTLRGGARPVRWIGQRRIDAGRHPGRLSPVRVRAHAFGPGRPLRDLLLSPDHALFVDDVLIPVHALVNGRSIVQTGIERVTYYHVELESHDVVLAEDLPAESFLDTGNRGAFAGRVMHLQPDFAAAVWDAAGYAPLVITGPRVDAVRARLEAQAARPAARRRA
jgi:hypothetical protein